MPDHPHKLGGSEGVLTVLKWNAHLHLKVNAYMNLDARAEMWVCHLMDGPSMTHLTRATPTPSCH
jgi:hypothetical protein